MKYIIIALLATTITSIYQDQKPSTPHYHQKNQHKHIKPYHHHNHTQKHNHLHNYQDHHHYQNNYYYHPNRAALLTIKQIGKAHFKLVSNKDDIYKIKFVPLNNKRSQHCRIRKGSKGTPWAWNSNHFMVTGNGSRSVFFWVPFSSAFPNNQNVKVSTSVAGLDTSKNRNLRVFGRSVWSNRFGFILKISTWANTKIYWANYSYVACQNCQ